MTRLKFVRVVLSCLAAGMLAWGLFTPACPVAMDGLTLAQQVYDRDAGKDSQANVRMLLIDKHNKKKFRKLIMAVKDYDGIAKSYTRFTSPASIEGTAFLTWENKGRDDDQFLYLPALKRVRRIVTTQKSNRFVNTDYSYEDLQVREVADDEHRLLREELFETYDCWVLESIPKDPDGTQYGKRISWIIKDSYLPVKIEYYDKRERLIKRFLARKIQKIDGIWTAVETEMKDLKRKHRTLMKSNDIRYNKGVPDRVFTKGYMKHKG